MDHGTVCRRVGSRSGISYVFMLAMLFMTTSARRDAEARRENGLAVLERAIVEPVQNVLQKGHTLVENHVEWVVNLSHNEIRPDVEPSVASLPPTLTIDNSRDSLITSPPSLRNRAALPEPQGPPPPPPSLSSSAPPSPPPPPCDCSLQINAVKSDDARVLSATVADLQRQSSLAVYDLQRQSSQAVSDLQRQSSLAVSQAQAAQTLAQEAQLSAQSKADAANGTAFAAQSASLNIFNSASSALSLASISASSVSASAASVTASASAALAAATASMNKAVADAQSSASASVFLAFQSASQSVALVQLSASQSIATVRSSAASVMSDAQATATVALQQAKETISSAALEAAASVRASQVQAITAIQIAIAIVGSIIGSSLLSILGYFLISRYKKRKAARKQQTASSNRLTGGDMKERRYTSRSMSDPMLADRRYTSRSLSNPEFEERPYMQGDWKRSITLSDFPVPGNVDKDGTKKFHWSSRSAAEETDENSGPLSSGTKTVTLTYDPQYPTRPPTIASRLGESPGLVSPFGSFQMSMDGKERNNNVKRAAEDAKPELRKERKNSVIGTAI